MRVKPIGNRVLVEMVAPASETAGGLIVPEVVKAKQARERARVVAVGEGRRLESGQVVPVPVSVGDHVLFGPRTPAVDVPRSDGEPAQHLVDAEFIVAVEIPAPVIVRAPAMPV